jgi:hypothetical protein
MTVLDFNIFQTRAYTYMVIYEVELIGALCIMGAPSHQGLPMLHLKFTNFYIIMQIPTISFNLYNSMKIITYL